MSITSDLDAMLAGWGSATVRLNGRTVSALVDVADVLETDRSGEPVLKRRTLVRLPRHDWEVDGEPTITRDDAMTIDGVAHTVSDVRVGGADANESLELDGAELHVVVRRA